MPLAPPLRTDDDEQEGAPIDFGGPVFANPDHVKPQWDTDQPDIGQRLSGGAKMITDPAPGGARMDASNPPPADLIAPPMQDASAKMIGPPKYNAPPPAPSAPAPGLGGNEAATTKSLPPPSGASAPPPAPPHPLQETMASGLPGATPNQLEPPPGKVEFHSLLKQFGNQQELNNAQMLKLLSNPNDPTALEKAAQLHTANEMIEGEKARVKLMHPWGSPGNHDNLGGKLGHIFAEIGSAAAPGIAAQIPGSRPNLEGEVAKEDKEIAGNEENKLKSAEAGRTEAGIPVEQAQTGEAQARTKAIENPPASWKAATGLVGPNGEPIELNEKTGEYRLGPPGAKPTKVPGETQEQNKLAFQGTVSKVAAGGLSTDPKALPKSLQAAQQKGLITPQERDAASGYLSANSTPSNQITVNLEGEAQKNADARSKLLEGKDVIVHTPQGDVLMSSKEAQDKGYDDYTILAGVAGQTMKDRVANADASMSALNRYEQSFVSAAPKLTDKDRDAMRVITSNMQESTKSGVLGGLIDELPIAGPLTTYANKLLNGTMTSDQYNALSPAGKKLVSDYSMAVIANFANMKQMLNTIGRNQTMITAETNMIPLPYLDYESAKAKFDDKRSDITQRNGSLPKIYKTGQPTSQNGQNTPGAGPPASGFAQWKAAQSGGK